MKGPVQSVEVVYFLHSTEDHAKVSGAVAKLISAQGEPDAEELEGHFGNKIVRARYHLTGDEASRAVSGLAAQMPERLKIDVKENMGEMVDEHSAFYLRLDKQKLVEGTLVEGSVDAVRIKVKPRMFLMKGGTKEFYLGLLGIG